MGTYWPGIRKPYRTGVTSHKDFHERKAERKEFYEKFVRGWKLERCGACSGSGYYDDNGHPKCGLCGGTGKVRCPPTQAVTSGTPGA